MSVPELHIASLGRAGSSLLFRCLNAQSKTHRFASDLPNNKASHVIFTFANPVSIILSLHSIYYHQRLVKDCGLRGADFIHAHAKNMNARCTKPHEVITRMMNEDVFNLEAMFDDFMRPHLDKDWKLLTLRYETMWNNQEAIGDFLNRPVNLPSKQQRAADAIDDEAMIKQLNATYERLCKKVAAANDVKVWE